MRIICVGLTHRLAPLTIRERLHFSDDALAAALARFACGEGRPPGILEMAIVSTCNRVELYVVAAPNGELYPERYALDFLSESRGIQTHILDAWTSVDQGLDVARHLARVAAGLDSQVLGEPQILGQVGDALKSAVVYGAAGRVLTRLFQAAIRAGRRARHETAINRMPASVSSIAVQAAEKILTRLDHRRIIVVGAGDTGVAALRALVDRGARDLAIVNRTRARAESLAAELGATAHVYEQLSDLLVGADLVVSCTGAPHPLIHRDMVLDAMRPRPSRSLVILDIAVPRDVDREVRLLPGVFLYDLDDLRVELDDNLENRRLEVPRVERIVEEECRNFAAWLSSVDIAPLVAQWRRQAESIRQRELQRLLRLIPDLDDPTRRAVVQFSRALVNRLLHQPTAELRRQAGTAQAVVSAELIRQLFGVADAADVPRFVPRVSDFKEFKNLT
jgi:glutamyl-tRNA reductase